MSSRASESLRAPENERGVCFFLCSATLRTARESELCPDPVRIGLPYEHRQREISLSRFLTRGAIYSCGKIEHARNLPARILHRRASCSRRVVRHRRPQFAPILREL